MVSSPHPCPPPPPPQIAASASSSNPRSSEDPRSLIDANARTPFGVARHLHRRSMLAMLHPLTDWGIWTAAQERARTVQAQLECVVPPLYKLAARVGGVISRYRSRYLDVEIGIFTPE